MNLLATGRADQFPISSGICGAINAFKCSSHQDIRIGWRLRERSNGLSVQAARFNESLSAVMADPKAAVRVIELPCRGVDGGAVGLIHENVIDNQVIRVVEVSELPPGSSFIQRLVDE